MIFASACATPPPRPAPAPAPQAPPPRAELDPALGLLVRVKGAKLQIPIGWRLDPTREDTWEAPTEGPDAAPGATMNLLPGPARPPDQPWEALWRALSDEYHRRAGHLQTFSQEGPLALPRADAAWRFLIERREHDHTFRLYQVIAGHRDRTWVMTWSAPAEHFDRLHDLFARSAASLRPDPQ